MTTRTTTRLSAAEPTVAVVVPVRNESRSIDGFLEHLCTGQRVDELIVCDGDSGDDTAARVAQFAAGLPPGSVAPRLRRASPGRARQMNAAAAAANADVLLFLHADTRLPPGALDEVRRAVAAGALWGRFDVRLSGAHALLRLVERLMNLRSRLSGIATGDQAMFVRADAFRLVGGFPEQPLMEDVALSGRLKPLDHPVCLRGPVTTSARRWQRRGVLSTILLMWALRLAYALGVSPVHLGRWYGEVRQ